MKIDVHCHFIPEQFIERDAAMPRSTYGVRITDAAGRLLQHQSPRDVPGSDFDQVCRLERRERDMDRLGIDMQVLSVLPWLFAYHLEPTLGVAVCRVLNDAFAAAIAARPGRFVALAHVPLQAPEAADQWPQTWFSAA